MNSVLNGAVGFIGQVTPATIEDTLGLEAGAAGMLAIFATVGVTIIVGGFGIMFGHKMYRLVRRYFS